MRHTPFSSLEDVSVAQAHIESRARIADWCSAIQQRVEGSEQHILTGR